MRASTKYALDKLFLFMLFVSLVLFGIEFFIEIDSHMLHIIEYVDFAIIGGYYVYFFTGLKDATDKLNFCKKHVFLIVLLLMPIMPLARFLRIPLVQRVLKLGSDVAWHLLDEIGML